MSVCVCVEVTVTSRLCVVAPSATSTALAYMHFTDCVSDVGVSVVCLLIGCSAIFGSILNAHIHTKNKTKQEDKENKVI